MTSFPVFALNDYLVHRDQRFRLQLHRRPLGCNLARRNRNACAPAVSPDRKRDEQQIETNEYRHVSLATDAEAVAVQPFAQYKVHAVPRH